MKKLCYINKSYVINYCVVLNFIFFLKIKEFLSFFLYNTITIINNYVRPQDFFDSSDVVTIPSSLT